MSSEETPALDPDLELDGAAPNSDEAATKARSESTASGASGRNHGMLITILVTAALVLGLWFAFGHGADKSQHFAAMSSSQHTIVLMSMNDLDRSYRRVLRILKVFPSVEGAWSMLWKNQDKTPSGFDPSKADSWRAIGIDPEIGVALVIDNRLTSPGEIAPLGYIATPDPTPLIDLVAQWSGTKLPIIKGTDFNGLRLGNSAIILYAPIGDMTVITIAENAGGESVDQLAKRIGLTKVLKDSWKEGPRLVDSERYARALGDSVGTRQAMAYFDVENLRAVLKGQPMLESIGNQVAQWIEGAGVQLGDQGFVTRVLTTNAGQTLVEQLVHVKGKDPKFARRLPQGAWSAVRWSINLNGVLDGLTRALPPSAPQELRMGLGMIRVALPMATGISWEQITGGLSGHFMVGLSPPPPGSQQPQSLIALGVADDKMADQLINTAMKSLKTRIPIARPVTKKVSGLDGWTFIFEKMPMSVVRDGDMILIGSDEAVASGISGAKQSVTEDARKDIDLACIFGVMIDGSPFIPEVLAEDIKKDDGLLAFAQSPFVSFRAALDNRGLLWSQSRPAHIEDVLAFMAMIEGLPLPFEFPVKL